MSATLAFLMLGSALIASYFSVGQAYTPPGGWPPGQPYFTLWAVLNPDPFWGYYGGYHDMFYRLQAEFAKIGINLEIKIQGDMYDNWYLMWEAPLGGRPPGKPPGHWDVTAMEWWIHPHGFLWMDGIILSKVIPPYGGNIFPYLRRENDELYWKMQTSFDAEVRKRYSWAWQEYQMHNPPIINVYYPNIYHFRGKYIKGYDETVWWYDLSNMRINTTGLTLPSAVQDRLNAGTIIYGAAEAWWSYLVTFVDSYTEEQYANLVWGILYKSSLDPWPAEGVTPPPEDYTLKPWLASDFPQGIGWFTDTDGKQVYRTRVPLRQGVVWSDGYPFNATDVKYSFDLILDKYVLSTAWGDIAPIIKRAELVPGNPYAIDFILFEPYVDLPLILADTWGGGILPYHALKDISPTSLRGSPKNKIFSHAKTVPQIGPFMYDSESTPAGYSDITFVRNPKFFGYDLGWGPYGIEKVILKYVPDAETRLAEIQTHAIDFGEYPTAPVEVFEGLMGDPTLIVQACPYVSSNDIWLNFNNPQLSNRYVRLALAHAIPYDALFAEIFPGWGIVNPIPGKSWVLPWSVYHEPDALGGETVRLFNTELSTYTYDIAKAKQYLAMWNYSRVGKDYTKGPVGDADFDGTVDLDDLWQFLDKFGSSCGYPLPYPIDWWPLEWSDGIYPWPVESGASVAPGNDIDPDFNNDGTVSAADFTLWFNNWGREYPFPGAW